MSETKPVVPLWKHQIIGLERFKKMGGSFGFLFDVGTGKTREAIESLRYLFNYHGEALPTLILAPLIMLEKWKREILEHTKIPERQIIVLHGDPKKKGKLLSEAHGKIIITNYEGLLSDMVYDWLTVNQPKVIIADEFHYIKTHNSKRTKKIHKLAENALYRVGLSGTPYLNSYEDLWSQIYFLDLGQRLGKKFHVFKVKYFYDKNAGMPSHKHFPNWQLRPGMEEELNRLIADITMSVSRDDCLDLPPFIKEPPIDVPLGKEQARVYEDLKRDFVAYLSDAACVAQLAIVKAIRLQQVIAGYLPLDDGSVHVFKENPRLDILEEYLQELTPHHKVIVWAGFKESHKQITKLLDKMKIKYVSLTGEESKNEKVENVKAFETDPKVRVCVGNQSVGIGIDLVESDVSIYYTRTFNLGHDIQSEARNYRAGSEKHSKVTRLDLVAPGTIDEQIYIALDQKKSIGAKLLKDIALDI